VLGVEALAEAADWETSATRLAAPVGWSESNEMCHSGLRTDTMELCSASPKTNRMSEPELMR